VAGGSPGGVTVWDRFNNRCGHILKYTNRPL
jgi:hypothetical protein